MQENNFASAKLLARQKTISSHSREQRQREIKGALRPHKKVFKTEKQTLNFTSLHLRARTYRLASLKHKLVSSN